VVVASNLTIWPGKSEAFMSAGLQKYEQPTVAIVAMAPALQ
jgi:hypothetical protein